MRKIDILEEVDIDLSFRTIDIYSSLASKLFIEVIGIEDQKKRLEEETEVEKVIYQLIDSMNLRNKRILADFHKYLEWSMQKETLEIGGAVLGKFVNHFKL